MSENGVGFFREFGKWSCRGKRYPFRQYTDRLPATKKSLLPGTPAEGILHSVFGLCFSGLSDDDFRNAIRDGMAKVNIFTVLNCACAKAAHDFYQPGCGMTDLIPHLTEAVKAATLKKMKLFGCIGRVWEKAAVLYGWPLLLRKYTKIHKYLLYIKEIFGKIKCVHNNM